jgi:hypothetical protein
MSASDRTKGKGSSQQAKSVQWTTELAKFAETPPTSTFDSELPDRGTGDSASNGSVKPGQPVLSLEVRARTLVHKKEYMQEVQDLRALGISDLLAQVQVSELGDKMYAELEKFLYLIEGNDMSSKKAFLWRLIWQTIVDHVLPDSNTYKLEWDMSAKSHLDSCTG